MIIKHAINPATRQEYDNEFVALDEQQRIVGTCRVDSMFCHRLFPQRPHQIQIEFEGDKAARAALLGAATAQAMIYAMRENVPARIYAPCQPDATERIVQLNEFGYEDNDGVVRMARFIDQPVKNPEIPEGVVVLKDKLDDATEAKFFLRRYNRLYDGNETMDLVDEWTALPGFRRYLLIHDEGLLGEVLAARDGDVGTILFIQVNGEYVRTGLGSYLMQLAMCMLAREGAKRIDMDVRVRVPGLMRFVKAHGFEQHELVCRLLGMDWNPGAEEKRMRQRVREAEQPVAAQERGEWDAPTKDEREKPIAQDPSDWD